MGLNQGIIRYSKGCYRKLTKSEQNRGYIFISKDKNIINMENIRIVINDDIFVENKIDGSGRVYVGKQVVREIGGEDVYFCLKNNTFLISY